MKTSIRLFLLWCTALNANALALRSFISMPIEQGGAVGRIFMARNDSLNLDSVQGSFGLGLANRHTLFFAYPALVRAFDAPKDMNPAILYRYVFLQKDEEHSTFRMGVLGGGSLSNTRNQGGSYIFGGVGSYFKGRHEVDFDAVFAYGTGNLPDMGRYDVSWQYRLLPLESPDWGLFNMLNSVLEYNGRWMRGMPLVHQTTIGLQMVGPQFIYEAGYIKDLNFKHNDRFMVGIRIHA